MLDKIQKLAKNTKVQATFRKIAAIISGIGAICFTIACIYLQVNDEVILGEGQDPIITWTFLLSSGTVLCSVYCLTSLYEYLTLIKSKNKDEVIACLIPVCMGLCLPCFIMGIKNDVNYGPGQDAQTYFVEEADFQITFPKGFTPVEETVNENYHRLFVFKKGCSITVHIRIGWDTDNWSFYDFSRYIIEDYNNKITKVIMEPQGLDFNEFKAVRIVGKTEDDGFFKYRAYYDILHNGTKIRIAVIEDNLTGKPYDSFIKDCNELVRSIQFTD